MKKFLKKMWCDPVWSKVISSIIMLLLAPIGTWLYSLCKSTPINYKFIIWFLIVIITLFILWLIYYYTKRIFFKSKTSKGLSKSEQPDLKQKVKNLDNTEIKQHSEYAPMPSVPLFAKRIVDTFPGQRGLVWYFAGDAVNKLSEFFKEKFYFDKPTPDCMSDPFWWFRGHLSSPIYRFELLGKEKILINSDEYRINGIAVHQSNDPYKNYIYIETLAEKQTKACKYSMEQIQDEINRNGFAYERYGITQGRIISGSELDDGSSVVKGKVVKNVEAEERVRYLSDYNFIICAKQSVYNSHEFDVKSRDLFNQILQKSQSAEELFQFLSCLKKTQW